MPSIVNKKAGKRKVGEPADRHSIQIKLNDKEFEQLESDLAAASKGPGGAVRPGAYAKVSIAQHAKLFRLRESVSTVVLYHETYSKAELVDLLRSALDA